jgi:hypothetical protein
VDCLPVHKVHYSSTGARSLTRKQPANRVFGRPANDLQTVVREISLRRNYLCSTSTPKFLYGQNYRSILVPRKGLAIRFCDLAIRPLDRPLNLNSNARGAARKRGGSTLSQAPPRHRSLELYWVARNEHRFIGLSRSVTYSPSRIREGAKIACYYAFAKFQPL